MTSYSLLPFPTPSHSLLLFSGSPSLTSVNDINSSSDVSVDAASSALSHTASADAPGPAPEAAPQSAIPRLNLAAVARATDSEQPPLLARNDLERGDVGQDSAAENEVFGDDRMHPPHAPSNIDTGSDQYSDDDLSSSDGGADPSLVAVRAAEVFSLLFSQIDYSLIDGFAYISSDAPSVSLEQLLAFCRQYLSNAFSDDDARKLFQEMDTDGDGRISGSDWDMYFKHVVAARDCDSESLPDAVRDHVTGVPAVAGTSAIPSADSSVRSAVLAAAAASGVELQDSDISQELLETLQQLQQELIHGAAHALNLHSASSQLVQSGDLLSAPPQPSSSGASHAP